MEEAEGVCSQSPKTMEEVHHLDKDKEKNKLRKAKSCTENGVFLYMTFL